jgi:hypothetical protein
LRIRTRITAALLAVPAIAVLGLGAATAASASVKSYTASAVTSVSNRPDSGDHGDWAYDAFSRSAKVTLLSEVALSYCGGATGTGHCYHWSGKITDAGTFATIVGDTSPGNGLENGGDPAAIGAAVKGTIAGSYSYNFYSSWKTANRALVPSAENDQGNLPGGRSTTGAWVEQFFGSGARFYVSGAQSSELGTTGSWKYAAAFGADSACPAVASQWTDASPDWGANAVDGNVLAPDASHC